MFTLQWFAARNSLHVVKRTLAHPTLGCNKGMLQCLSTCICKSACGMQCSGMSLAPGFTQCKYKVIAQEIPKQCCCQRFAAGELRHCTAGMGCNATSLLADAAQHTTQMHSFYVHAKMSPSKGRLGRFTWYFVSRLGNFTNESKQEGKQASQVHDGQHWQGK